MPTIRTEADAFCVEETMKHRLMVEKIMKKLIELLDLRSKSHDISKLEDPEFPLFSVWTPKLANLTYGTDEYQRALGELRPALEHHYANNRHHPEHFKNGVKDMNLIDLIEMLADWYCASKRHNDGNIRKSIEINKNRFSFSDELATILENTVELID